MEAEFKNGAQEQTNVGAFGHAKELMENISSEILPGINSVTPQDFPLFKSFFANTPYTYGNSWTYLLQAMNSVGNYGFGYKYFDGDNLIPIVAYPGVTNPENLSLYFIRPMGTNPLMKIVEMRDKLRSAGVDLPIYVKKLFPTQRGLLLDNGFHDISERPWHPTAHSEDDTYPELIFDRKSLLELNLQEEFKHKKLREASSAIRKLYGNSLDFSSEDFEKNAWAITQDFFTNVPIKYNIANISHPRDYYNMIFRNNSRDGLDRKLIRINGVPYGYYVTEEDEGGKYTNLYSMLTLRHKADRLNDAVMIHLLKNIRTPYLATGGSESEGLDNYKRKFSPISEIPMSWLVDTVD